MSNFHIRFSGIDAKDMGVIYLVSADKGEVRPTTKHNNLVALRLEREYLERLLAL